MDNSTSVLMPIFRTLSKKSLIYAGLRVLVKIRENPESRMVSSFIEKGAEYELMDRTPVLLSYPSL
jgi:hypothetical protein